LVRFDLDQVTMDDARDFNGTVDDYGDGGVAIPDAATTAGEGFEQDALRPSLRRSRSS